MHRTCTVTQLKKSAQDTSSLIERLDAVGHEVAHILHCLEVGALAMRPFAAKDGVIGVAFQPADGSHDGICRDAIAGLVLGVMIGFQLFHSSFVINRNRMALPWPTWDRQ